MKKIVIVNGLISGAIVSTIMAISMAMCVSNPSFEGSSSSMLVGYAAQVLALSLIFVAVKTYRDKYNGGQITFGKALQIGLLISLIASVMYVAVWAVEYNTFASNFMEAYTNKGIARINASTATQAVKDKQIAQMNWARDMYHNPFFFTLITLSEIFPTGLVISLICALILKRKNNPQSSAVS